MPVRAAVALHTDRTNIRKQHDRALPDVTVEPGRGQLLTRDCVSLAKHVEPIARDLADNANPETRPGERLTPHDLGGQPELLADLADLVLEQGAQRLDQ